MGGGIFFISTFFFKFSEIIVYVYYFYKLKTIKLTYFKIISMTHSYPQMLFRANLPPTLDYEKLFKIVQFS